MTAEEKPTKLIAGQCDAAWVVKDARTGKKLYYVQSADSAKDEIFEYETGPDRSGYPLRKHVPKVVFNHDKKEVWINVTEDDLQPAS